MANKGVFRDDLDDLDDIMPPAIPRPEAEGKAAEVETGTEDTAAPRRGEIDTTVDDETGTAADISTGSGQRTRHRPAMFVPTAEVAPHIHQYLRKLTTNEKSRDPIHARTYAQVVLDAIEAHQEQLSTHWTTQTAGASAKGGLFSRRPAAPARRRRHAEPPARVPLAGLNAADSQTLDQLVAEWKAPSRSELVEQALRLYLKEAFPKVKAFD